MPQNRAAAGSTLLLDAECLWICVQHLPIRHAVLYVATADNGLWICTELASTQQQQQQQQQLYGFRDLQKSSAAEATV
ncbi:hypothetical protein LTS18_000556, partial [Coniosporium uncinatum]